MTHGTIREKPNRLRRALLPGVMLFVLAGVMAPVGAQTPAAEDVKRKIAAIDARLADVAREHREIQDRIESLERERRSQVAEVEAARQRRDAASAEIREWAREAYKRGGDTYLGAMLAVEDPAEMAARNAYLERVADRARRSAAEAAAATQDLQSRVEELEALEQSEREELERVGAAEAELKSEQEKQQEILASIPPPPPPTTAPAQGSGTGGASGGGGGSGEPQPPAATGSGEGEIYEITCYSDSGYTASGQPVGPGVAATDPRVIPLGTSFKIEGLGTYTAYDTGGAVKGKIIDIWNPSDSWCEEFGRQRRSVVVYR
ncbi:MAG: hypothetical protein IT198_11545 [Acidimicrobiia bacterium]|nr:hypothetical protein [Acidimicrobiia bacterium]